MNTLEFYNFGVKITYSRIKVYTRRSHILWIHSLNFASRRMLCTRTVTFFYKVLFTKGSPSYSRITTDVWYTLTKILERLWTERIPPYSTRIFQVYVTCCVRLEYSRILLRHNHIFESRILQNILAFTQCDTFVRISLCGRTHLFSSTVQRATACSWDHYWKRLESAVGYARTRSYLSYTMYKSEQPQLINT